MKQDYFMAYVWEDTDSEERELKFGDHFVANCPSLADAETDTRKYIRGTLARQKYKFDKERVVIHKIWDISEYAKRVGKFYSHAKCDDILRMVLPNRIGSTDVHVMDPDDLITSINQELSKFESTLPVAGLSTYQHLIAHEVFDQFNAGKRIVLADLCARFGKTIWAGVIAREISADITVIACYVKTAFASFMKELTSYEQFRTIVQVDTQNPNYKNQIATALQNGQQVFAYLSLANGQKRQERIDYLFCIDCKRLLIVDEADFGAHQPKQTLPLIAAVKPSDRVVLMTGTNADRAASTWKLDAIPITVTYPELLMQKTTRDSGDPRKLKYFDVNPERDLVVPGLECYQMDLRGPVNRAISNNEISDEEFKFLPSWTKFSAHPVKSKGFFTRSLQAIFLGMHGFDELNVDLQTEQLVAEQSKSKYSSPISPKVVMMFMPANTRVENLKTMANIATSALPDSWDVIPLSGGIKIDGVKISNANAERFCKDRISSNIKNKKNTIIMAAQLAQRSFSIPQITELYLAYDKGEVGSTIQKMSRTLTPSSADKIGRVISLSFDPNRDDKFDSMILETALNYRKRHNKKSILDSLRDVLRTIDIWQCEQDGRARIDMDTYLRHLLDRDSLSRVMGKTADLSQLTDDAIHALVNGDNNYFQNPDVNTAQKGDTRDAKESNKTQKQVSDELEKILARVREVITSIVENMDVIIFGSNSDNLTDAITTVSASVSLQADVQEEFGVSFDTIKYLLDQKVINREWLEFMYDNKHSTV
jgi:hypothetical protein